MADFRTHILLFFLPLVLGNIIHMIVVRRDFLSFLKIPVSIRWFGSNKTLRGFVVLPLLCAAWVCIFSVFFGPLTFSLYRDILIGMGLGFVYMISELPNSFIKRRLGIANGQQSERFKAVQIFADKMDSIVGVLAFYYFIVPISMETIAIIFLAALALHMIISYLLVLLKVKKSF